MGVGVGELPLDSHDCGTFHREEMKQMDATENHQLPLILPKSTIDTQDVFKPEPNGYETFNRLVVEPTPLKNIVKLEIFPNFRGENKQKWVATTYVNLFAFFSITLFGQNTGISRPENPKRPKPRGRSHVCSGRFLPWENWMIGPTAKNIHTYMRKKQVNIYNYI